MCLNSTHTAISDVCDRNIPEAGNMSYFASDQMHLNIMF